MKSLFPITTLAATLLGAAAALAAPAMATRPLYLHTGPGFAYPVEATMPAGDFVDVAGCTHGYRWCRVNWRGYDGWVVSDHLAYREGPHRGRHFSAYGAELGIPLLGGAIIGGAIIGHHDHYDHYDQHDRGRWHDRRDDHGQYGHDDHHGRDSRQADNHGHDNHGHGWDGHGGDGHDNHGHGWDGHGWDGRDNHGHGWDGHGWDGRDWHHPWPQQ